MALNPIVPSWMKIDAEAQSVELDVDSSSTSNNGSFNFNGYANGEIRIVIPLGWRVRVEFFNPDANYPHSAVITKAYAKDDIPQSAEGRDAVLRRAFTRSPVQGLQNAGDSFRFTATADKEGDYYLFCGVAGHGASGMWVHFSLRGSARLPHILIEKEPPVPGRP